MRHETIVVIRLALLCVVVIPFSSVVCSDVVAGSSAASTVVAGLAQTPVSVT